MLLSKGYIRKVDHLVGFRVPGEYVSETTVLFGFDGVLCMTVLPINVAIHRHVGFLSESH